eukprot:g6343.t1
MRSFICFAPLLAVALSAPPQSPVQLSRATDGLPPFDAWARAHGKVYASAQEREHRRTVYEQALARCRRRNTEEGARGARYGATRDSDRTDQELAAREPLAAVRRRAPTDVSRVPAFSAAELAAASASAAPSIDWVARGGVTPVQQQHPFGTCWAFSMVAAAEGAMVAQGKKKLVKLSEQNVISCVPQDDDAQTMDFTVDGLRGVTGGRLQTEADYPYNRTCNFVREDVLAPDGTRDGWNGTCNDSIPLLHGHCTPCPGIKRIDGTPPCRVTDPATTHFSEASLQDWGYVPATDDDAPMVAALDKFGPLQIAIGTACLHGYTGGIVTNCTGGSQGHAVTIVGAGTDPATGVPYWKVKNSWDTVFGEQGFYRVARSPPQMALTEAYIACFEKGCYNHSGAF